MSWLRWVLNQLIKSKTCLIAVVILTGLILIHGTYNYSQDLETIASMTRFIDDQQRAISRGLGYIQVQKLFEEDFDRDGRLQDLLKDQSQALIDWKVKLYQEDYQISTEQIKFYQAVLDPELMENHVPQGVWPQVARENLAKAQYMENHALALVEEEVPFETPLFSLQVSKWYFSILSVFLIIFLFGNSLLQDSQDLKLPLYFSLPLSKKQILAKDELRIGIFVALSLLVFLLSLIPSLLNQNLNLLIYPFIVSDGNHLNVLPIWQVILFRIYSWILNLLWIHLFSRLFLKITKSIEGQVLFTSIFCVIGILILSPNHWQFYNPMSYLFQENIILLSDNWLQIYTLMTIFAIIFWYLIYRSNFLLDLALNLNQAQGHQQSRFISKVQNYLPTWFGFELVKKLNLTYVSRLITLASLILLIFLGSLTYMGHNASSNYSEIIKDDIQFRENTLSAEESIYNEILVSQFSYLEPLWQEEAQDGQSFTDWYAHHEQSSTFGNLPQNIGQNKELIEDGRQLIKKLETHQTKPQDIWTYRNKLNRFILDRSREAKGISINNLVEADRLAYYNTTGIIAPYLSYFPVIQVPNYPLDINQLFQPIELETSSLFSGYQYLQLYGGVIMVVLLISAFTSSITDELNPPHYRLLASLPRNIKHWYLNKWIYNIGTFISLFLIVVIVFLLVTYTIGGIGNWSYPVPIYDATIEAPNATYAQLEQIYFHLIDMGSYVIQELCLLLAIGIFLLSLLLFLSNYIQHRISLIMTFLIVCLTGYWLQFNHIESSWITYLPFIYLNSREVTNGWWQSLSNNPRMTVEFASIILLTWAFVLTSLGNLRWSQRTLTIISRKG